MVCCGLRKEPCAAINAQIIKTRRLERSSKKAGEIKQEGWKRPSKKVGKDQARRLEKIKQEGWKRLSKKAGKDQARRLEKTKQEGYKF